MNDPIKRGLTSPKMRNFLKAVELLRVLDREVPGQVMSAFAYIASHNPCHKQALEIDLGFSTASASRVTDWLSHSHRLGKQGLCLIEKVSDPSNYRRTLLRLTPQGEALKVQLLEILYG